MKRRLKTTARAGRTLTDEQACFVGFCYRELYDEPLDLDFTRALDISYRRSTLVAKVGGERMTLDCQLQFLASGRIAAVDEDLYIIETKSKNGNGIADQYLRRQHLHPADHCSKYCTGLAILKDDLPSNNFRSTMLKLGWHQ